MSDRQQRWLGRGYTREQIENHLSFERYKNKQSRERWVRNNEKNKEIIKKIKNEIVGKTFRNIKILSINPSTDGKGFWYKQFKTFKDGSEGEFRYFCFFSDYSLENFKKDLFYEL